MQLKSLFNINTLTIAFQKPYDVTTKEGRSLERRRRIALTALTSTILRVLQMAIPLITLKITLDYLNIEVYGLWSAITTVFALFAFTDLGLGNGLQTKLSQANGKDDIELCRRLISNTYTILLSVALILLIIFLITFPFINWGKIVNAQSSETIALVSSVVFVIVLPKILSIPVAIIQRTQLALQEGYRSDIWSIIGVILNLIIVIVIAKLDLGKITLLSATSFLPLVVSALNMYVYFNFQRKELKFSFKLFEFKLSKSLLSLGILFTFLAVLTTIGLSMDTFIVAKNYNLSEAGSYSIIYKLNSIFLAVISIISAPLWGANGEAIARGDLQWVKNNTKKMSRIMALTSTLLVIFGLISVKHIFRIWLGDEFTFSYSAFLYLSIMSILLSFISPYFMVLNASGKIKIQLILFGIFTPVSFILKYYLSTLYGVYIIPLTGFILYFVVIILGIYLYTNKLFKSDKFLN